jgi:hypothetical protein
MSFRLSSVLDLIWSLFCHLCFNLGCNQGCILDCHLGFHLMRKFGLSSWLHKGCHLSRLSSGVVIWRCHLALSSDVVIWCCHLALSSGVVIWVDIWCCHLGAILIVIWAVIWYGMVSLSKLLSHIVICDNTSRIVFVYYSHCWRAGATSFRLETVP